MRKQLLILLLTLIMVSQTAFAYDLNATIGCGDMNCIGGTIVRGAFGGDYTFFAIIFFLMFAMFIWQAGIPNGAALAIGVVLIFSMSSFLGTTYTVLFNLAILVIGATVAISILRLIGFKQR